MSDSLIHEEMPMPKKIRLEIPVGAIESDSGNHIVDVVFIVFIVLILYAGKKAIDNLFNNWNKGKDE